MSAAAAPSEEIAEYDVLVIGSGLGLAKLSVPAAVNGLKVALVERAGIGGTCLLRGCTPTKWLIQTAHAAEVVHTAKDFDVNVPEGEVSVDYKRLVERVFTKIESDSVRHGKGAEKKGVEMIHGEARFVGERMVEVNGKRLRGAKVFVCAGGRPSVPPIPGLKDVPYMTSTEALRMPEQPRELVVIGGGYIGSELASFFAAIGTKVHVLEAMPSLVGMEDEEIRDAYTKFVTEGNVRNLKVEVSVKIHSVKHTEDGVFELDVERSDGKREPVRAPHLLVATGVKPNTDTLDVAKAGIEVTKRGFVVVDKYLRTTAKNVWAGGDIAGNFMFRHSANFEGAYLMTNAILEQTDEPIDYPPMPHAIFTSPQMAGVGLREQDCKEQKLDYVVGRGHYDDIVMGEAIQSKIGMVKLMVERGSRRLLGAHLIGHEASIVMHEFAPLLVVGAKLDDLLRSIHVHPSLMEVVRNAARNARAALKKAGDELPPMLTYL